MRLGVFDMQLTYRSKISHVAMLTKFDPHKTTLQVV